MIIIKYKVTITETLSKTYEVEADTLANAEDIVTDRYYDALDGYILGADDLADVRIAAEERSKTMDILGHSSINTTRIYIISTANEHRQRMEKMRLII